MRKKRFVSLIPGLLVFLLVASPAIASVVSGADYQGVVRVSNTGSNSAANVSANFSLDSGNFTANGYASSNLSDVAIQINGTDTAFMPGANASYPWIVFAPSVVAGQNIDYDFYSSNATGGKISYFPGDAGMSANDSASLELADNFTIEQKGFIDTSQVGANLTSKPEAFWSGISATGNITAAVLSSDNTSPTGSDDPDSDWTNDAFAFDDNISTPAEESVGSTSPAGFLELTHSGLWASGVRARIGSDIGSANYCDIDIFFNSAWVNLYESNSPTEDEEVDYDLGGVFYLTAMRITVDATGGNAAHIYEVDFIGAAAAVNASGISIGEHTVSANYTPNLLTNSSFENGDPPDDWILIGANATISRSSTSAQYGDYSANLTRAGSDCYIYQNIANFADYASKTLTLAISGNISVANSARVRINDGVSSDYSSFHTGSGTPEWITVTKVIDSAPSSLQIAFQIVSNNASAYFDGAILIVGNSVADYNTFRLFVDDVEQDQIYTEVAVPDNSENWTFFVNSVMPYVEYHKIWIGDTLQQHIEWEYNPDLFTDLSGQGHHATPTFRTGSSNSDVSAALVSFGPVTEAKVDTFTLGGALIDQISETPTAPSQLYTEGDYSHIPGAEPANALLDEGEVPRALWWFPFIYIGIGIIGMLVYGATTMRVRQGVVSSDTQGEGSLLAMCIVCEVLLALVGIMNPVPLWPALLFPIAAGALIISKKHFSWG